MLFCVIVCPFFHRHTDSNMAFKNNKNLSISEEGFGGVYPLMLRISVIRETNILAVKISKKVCLSHLIIIVLLDVTSKFACLQSLQILNLCMFVNNFLLKY